uniref:protein TALPID3 n=1 Tax=Myxine glutinosa TaxID=7769 RepID=UPI0035902793
MNQYAPHQTPWIADVEDEASLGSESTTASQVASYPGDMLRPRTREVPHPAALDGVKSRAEELNFHTSDHWPHIWSVDSSEVEHQRCSEAEPFVETLAWQRQLDSTAHSTSSESSVVVSRCTRGEQKSARASIMHSHSQTLAKQQEVRVKFFPKPVPAMLEQSTVIREGHRSAVSERGLETTGEKTTTSADVATASGASSVALAVSAAPILKVHSDLEAKMTTVTELVASLQEQLERSKEERHTRDTERQDHPTEHLQRFIEKQLAFLEKLQTQQLHLQNHLLGKTSPSAILPSLSNPASEDLHSSRTSAAFSSQGTEVLTRTQSTCCSKHVRFSSLVDPCQEGPDTPAPRGVAPLPIPWAGKTTEGLPAGSGKKPAISAVSIEVSDGVPVQQIGEYREKQSTTPLPRCLLMSSVDPGPVQRMMGPTPSTFLTCLERPKDSPLAVNFSNHRSASTLRDTTNIRECVSEMAETRQKVTGSPLVLHSKQLLHELGRVTQDLQSLLKDQATLPTSSHVPEALSLSQTFPLVAIAEEPLSPLGYARRTLQKVQSSRKILDENLQVVSRACDDCGIFELLAKSTVDSDVAEKMRMKVAVSGLITSLSKEVEVEVQREWVNMASMSPQAPTSMEVGTGQQEGKTSSKVAPRPVRVPLGTSRQTKGNLLSESVPDRDAGKRVWNIGRRSTTSRSVAPKAKTISPKQPGFGLLPEPILDEASLGRIYGKAGQDGRRSTVLRPHYLHVNSPPYKRPWRARPRLIEFQKGVIVKSAQTQTPIQSAGPTSNLADRSGLGPSPEQAVAGRQTGSTSVAIPLALPKRHPVRLEPSIPTMGGLSRSVTLTTTIPPSKPPQHHRTVKPNTVIVDVKSEDARKPLWPKKEREQPVLAVQVLPNVDIKSTAKRRNSTSPCHIPHQDSLSISEWPASECNASSKGSTLEDAGFPGNSCVPTPPVEQVTVEDDPFRSFAQPAIQLDGGYTCSVPDPCSQDGADLTASAYDVIEERSRCRESVEQRALAWLEQEMLEHVLGTLPLYAQSLVEDAPNVQDPTSHTKQMVNGAKYQKNDMGRNLLLNEASGEGCHLQAIEVSKTPLDSALVSRLVSNALEEMVVDLVGRSRSTEQPPDLQQASTVGQPANGVDISSREFMLIQTPSPVPSPTQRECIAVPKPTSPSKVSEEEALQCQPQVVETEESKHSTLHEIQHMSIVSDVITLAVSPEPTPPQEGSRSPDMNAQDPWSGRDLPLVEEALSPGSDIGEERQKSQTMMMSVARDEEPQSLIEFQPLNVSDSQLKSTPSVSPTLRGPPVQPSTDSTSGSSISSTETETFDRHISDGEVLLSPGRLHALEVLTEAGISMVTGAESLCSTLHDTQDMDYDPPSDGQVVYQRSSRGLRDPVRILMSKRNDSVVHQQATCGWLQSSQGDGTMLSEGELSQGERLRLIPAAEAVITGCSPFETPPPLSALPSCHLLSMTDTTRPYLQKVQDNEPLGKRHQRKPVGLKQKSSQSPQKDGTNESNFQVNSSLHGKQVSSLNRRVIEIHQQRGSNAISEKHKETPNSELTSVPSRSPFTQPMDEKERTSKTANFGESIISEDMKQECADMTSDHH